VDSATHTWNVAHTSQFAILSQDTRPNPITQDHKQPLEVHEGMRNKPNKTEDEEQAEEAQRKIEAEGALVQQYRQELARAQQTEALLLQQFMQLRQEEEAGGGVGIGVGVDVPDRVALANDAVVPGACWVGLQVKESGAFDNLCFAVFLCEMLIAWCLL
jgi:hypothetical protein